MILRWQAANYEEYSRLLDGLPNATRARVDPEKVTRYLLATDHPDGQSKAQFFNRFGFRIEEEQVLIEALQRHGASYPVARIAESSYGTRYSVDGEMDTPDGRNPRVRTVWIIESGGAIPRLITAHPIRR